MTNLNRQSTASTPATIEGEQPAFDGTGRCAIHVRSSACGVIGTGIGKPRVAGYATVRQKDAGYATVPRVAGYATVRQKDAGYGTVRRITRDISRMPSQARSFIRYKSAALFTLLPLTLLLPDGNTVALYSTATVYASLFAERLCVRMHCAEVAHHAVWAVLLSMTPTLSTPRQLSILAKLVVAHCVPVALMILASQRRLDTLKHAALLCLACYRLVFVPVVWCACGPWRAWHHATFAFSAAWAVAEVWGFLRRVTQGLPRDLLFLAAARKQSVRLELVRVDDWASPPQILKSAVKGSFLEQFHALPTWSPAVSVESVDGEQWKRMLSGVHCVMRHTHAHTRARTVAREALAACGCAGHLQPQPRRVIAIIFHTLAFGTPPSEADVTLWVTTAVDVSEALAVKRERSNKAQLTAAVARATLLAETTCYWDELKAIAGKDATSCILQPFLISPIINVMDSLVAVAAISPPRHEGVVSAIAAHPPFPVLERWNDTLKTQFIINSDRMARRTSHPPDWLAFGAGPRKCPGQRLAIDIIDVVYYEWLIDNKSLLSSHTSSGRHADGRGAGMCTELAVAWRILHRMNKK